MGPSLPSVLTRQPASAWSQESGPPRQGGQTEERCFLTCLATTYHPHQDLNESGRGSDSLETRHTPGLLRGRMHGRPTKGSLLWTGPAPPLLTFGNMPVGKDLSDHTSPLSTSRSPTPPSIVVTHFKASLISGTCSTGVGTRSWERCPLQTPGRTRLGKAFGVEPSAFWLLEPHLQITAPGSKQKSQPSFSAPNPDWPGFCLQGSRELKARAREK